MNTFFELLTLLGKDMTLGSPEREFHIHLNKEGKPVLFTFLGKQEYLQIILRYGYSLWVTVQFVTMEDGIKKVEPACYIGEYMNGAWCDVEHTRDFDYILANDRVRKIIDAEYKRRSK